MRLTSLLVILLLSLNSFSQSPSLGNYPNTSVAAGGNISVTPNAVPNNTSFITAYTSTNFTGLIMVDTITGIVRITNAKPAGVYTITVSIDTLIFTTFTLTVTNGVCSTPHLTASTASVGTLPNAVCVSDFNNDGMQDVASANTTSANVSILLGNGIGGFSAATNISVSASPNFIFTADLNNDGNFDLVVSHATSSSITILLGNGSGGFTSSTINLGASCKAETFGDFNSDNKKDIVLLFTGSSSNARILFGNGNGTFITSAPNISLSLNPFSAVVRDFNGDGKQDLAIAHISRVQLRFGDGLGNFTNGTDVNVSASISQVISGDYNKDGKQDLVIVSGQNGVMYFRLGNGTGGFTGSTSIGGWSSLRYAAAIDANGDGNLDIVTSHYGAANIIAFQLGSGTGTFTLASPTGFSTDPNYIAVGDFNGDAIQDVVASSNSGSTVGILIGQAPEINILGNGNNIPNGSNLISSTINTDFGNTTNCNPVTKNFTISNPGADPLILSISNITGANPADFSVVGFSIPDTVPARSTYNFSVRFNPTSPGTHSARIYFYSNDCDENNFDFAVEGTSTGSPPTLGSYPSLPTVGSGQNIMINPITPPTFVAPMTVTSDPKFTGILTVNPTTGKVSATNVIDQPSHNLSIKSGSCLLQTINLQVHYPFACGHFDYLNYSSVQTGDQPYGVMVGDFNNDGLDDIATPNAGANTVSIRFGNGLGAFSGNIEIPVGTQPNAIGIADFNGDGNQDFITADYISNKVSVRLGDGTGGFTNAPDVSVGNNPFAFAVADFDDDGNYDFAVVNFSSNNVQIKLGDGTGGFTGNTVITTASQPMCITANDFNNDSKDDLAIGNYGSNSVYVELGDGFGNFSLTQILSSVPTPRALQVAELNANNKPDLVVASYTGNGLYIYGGNGISSTPFASPSFRSTGSGPNSIKIADFNGDFRPDIVTINNVSHNITMVNNTGTSYSASTLSGFGDFITAADLNNDERIDLIYSNLSNDSVFVMTGTDNQMNVQGNGVNIADGSTTVSAANNTDFGNLTQCTSSSKTYTIQNTGLSRLIISSIILTGANAAEFTLSGITIPDTINAGGTATFQLKLFPTGPGIRSATIHVNNSDCDQADWDFLVQGNANAPVTLGTYPASSVIAGGNTTVIPSVAPSNAIVLSAFTNSIFSGVITADPITGNIQITDAKPAGTYTVTVVSSVCATTTFTLIVTNPACGQVDMKFNSNIITGTSPQAMAIGDFNRDGIQDVATCVSGTNSVTIHLGNGTGGFTQVNNYTVGTLPTAIAVADFNSDGKSDFIVVNKTSATVSAYLGDGAGNFALSSTVSLFGMMTAIVTGDFNNDKKIDFAVAGTSGAVTIRLGDGTGQFTGFTTVSLGTDPTNIVAGNFNSDANLDIATVNNSTNNFTVAFGNGSGSFTNPTTYSTGTSPKGIVVGDFNQDGKQDLAITNSTAASITIKLNSGTGTFPTTTSVSTASTPTSLALGDFNSDGIQDLIASNNTTNALSICIGNGTGGFTNINRGQIAAATSPNTIVVGDFNSDNRMDALVASGNSNAVLEFLAIDNEINVTANGIIIPDGSTLISPSINTDFGTVDLCSSTSRSFNISNIGMDTLTISSISIIMLNDSDFYASNISSPVIFPGNTEILTVYFNPSSPGVKSAFIQINSNDCNEPNYSFKISGTGGSNNSSLGNYPNATVGISKSITVSPLSVPVASVINATASIGFTGVVTADLASGNVHISNASPPGNYLITVTAGSCASKTFNLTVSPSPICTHGSLDTLTYIGMGGSSKFVAVGDFNSDGHQDLAVAVYSLNRISIQLGNGQGGFSSQPNINTTSRPTSLAVSDFNNDGIQDLAVTSDTGNICSIILGNGNGTFGIPVNASVGSSPAMVAAGDFNKDGKKDVATVNTISNSVTIRLGNGSGGFYNNTITIATALTPYALAVSDLNSDGNLDLIVPASASNVVGIWLGNGNGTFIPSGNVSVGTGPRGVTIGDFNGDNFYDLAVSNFNSNTVSFRYGNGTGAFSGTYDIPVSNSPNAICNGDFNNDGKMDIALLNSYGYADALLNYNNIIFTTNSYPSTLVGNQPNHIAIGDFNEDGRLDIAGVSNFSYGSIPNRTLSIGIGIDVEVNVQGNGIDIPSGSTMTSPANNTDFGTTYICNSIQKIFNIQNVSTSNSGDHYSSFQFTGPNGSDFKLGSVNTSQITPAGSSLAVPVIFTPSGPGLRQATIKFTSFDCDEPIYEFALQGNGNGIPVVGQYPSTSVSLGGNTIVNPSSAPSNTNILSAYFSPGFNGLLVADPVSGQVRITNANPIGTFKIYVSAGACTVDSFQLTVAAGSCNNLGFSSAANFTVGTSPRSLAIGDFNSDNKQDLVIANYSSNNLSIKLGNGSGGFSGTSTIAVGTNPSGIAVTDFNNDGKQDLVVTNFTSNTISIYLGDGLGGFTFNSSIVPYGGKPLAVTIIDENFDGRSDIASITDQPGFENYNGDGFGNFTSLATGSNMPSSMFSLATAMTSYRINFNNNIHYYYAIALPFYTSSTARVYWGNNFTGFFASLPDPAVGPSPYGITLNDFNSDGKIDFATSNVGNNSVSVRLGGNGPGDWIVVPDFIISGSNPRSINTGDFNNDGITDLLTTNTSSSNVTVLTGNGNGTFGSSNLFSVGTQPTASVIGDFNGDGKQDIAVANMNSNNVSILLGKKAEVNVTGNGNTILDGSVSTSAVTNTDFGNSTVNTPVQKTFTIQNTGNVILNISSITVLGNNQSDFVISGLTLPTTVDTSSSKTFNVTFTPSAPGIRSTTIHINNNDCDEGDYDFVIKGFGLYDCSQNISDSNACTVDACDPVNGITHTIMNVDDNNPCTIDNCNSANGPSHLPVITDDGIAFTEDGCNSVTGIYHHKVFHLKLYIEGFYSGNGLMDNLGDGGCLYMTGITTNPSLADSVRLTFVQPNTLLDIETSMGILQTDGNASFNFQSTTPGSYYLKVNHRNAIETWSASPIDLITTNFYDFTISQNTAYGNNQTPTFDLLAWAFYSGDITNSNLAPGIQDGIISHADYVALEQALYLTKLGYVPEDLTGDGMVESLDYVAIENNVFYAIILMRP